MSDLIEPGRERAESRTQRVVYVAAYFSVTLLALGLVRWQAFADNSNIGTEADAGTSGRSFIWHTEKLGANGATQATSELADFYIALDRKNQLPTREVQDEAGRLPQQIVRDEQAYAGDGFPRTLEGLLCKLNPTTCSQQESGDGGVGFRWSNRAGDMVMIPDMTVYPYVAPQDFTKSAGQTMDSIVKRTGGCSVFDEDCKRIIENLNRRSIEELNKQNAEITVPAFGLRAVINRVQADSLPAKLRKDHISSEVRVKKDGDPLIPTVLPLDAGYAGNTELWSLIHHPFAHDGGVPKGTPVVEIVDTGVDFEHFNLSIPFVDNLGSTLGPVLKCRGDGRLDCDHGTHMAGLIGAQGKNNVLGVNPNARIVTYGLFPEELGNADLRTVAAPLMKALNATRLDVVNLSFQYPGDHDAGDDTPYHVDRWGRSVLFVAAAGNDGQDKSPVCDVRPACIRGRHFNVLSVVALTSARTPTRLSRSNYGSFDIAAPGDSIMSTLPHDRFGVLSGTSPATAIVSGAASLLFALDPRLRPRAVRQRLMYTADLEPAFEGMVRSGGLNIERAIHEIDQDCVWLINAPSPVCGIVKNKPSDTIAFSTRDDVEIRSVMRLVLNAQIDGMSNYTLVTCQKNDEDMNFERNVVLGINDKKRIFVRPRDSTITVPIRVNDIADFVARTDDSR